MRTPYWPSAPPLSRSEVKGLFSVTLISVQERFRSSGHVCHTMCTEKNHIRIVVVGHVNADKSTWSGQADQRLINKLEKESAEVRTFSIDPLLPSLFPRLPRTFYPAAPFRLAIASFLDRSLSRLKRESVWDGTAH